MTSGKPLTPEQRTTIERRMNAGEWPSVIAKDVGVCKMTITNIMRKKD